MATLDKMLKQCLRRHAKCKETPAILRNPLIGEAVEEIRKIPCIARLRVASLSYISYDFVNDTYRDREIPSLELRCSYSNDAIWAVVGKNINAKGKIAWSDYAYSRTYFDEEALSYEEARERIQSHSNFQGLIALTDKIKKLEGCEKDRLEVCWGADSESAFTPAMDHDFFFKRKSLHKKGHYWLHLELTRLIRLYMIGPDAKNEIKLIQRKEEQYLQRQKEKNRLEDMEKEIKELKERSHSHSYGYGGSHTIIVVF